MRSSGFLRASLSILCPVTCFVSLVPVATAQSAPDVSTDQVIPPTHAYRGDFLVVGAGLANIPSYEGSDEDALIPAFGATGRVAGINIGARAGGISLDLLPDDIVTGSLSDRLGFTLGPVARYNGNRTGHIKDPVVARLGKLKGTVEAGITAGVSLKRVLNSQDSLSVGADIRWDISGRGAGRIVTPGVSYFTPVSRAVVVGTSLSADFIDARHGNYHFGISAPGSAASGLPQFAARGGMKSFGINGFAALDLDGDLLNGGFAVAAGAAWSRLVGSAAQSPIVSLRGSRDQWAVAGGLAYTFW